MREVISDQAPGGTVRCSNTSRSKGKGKAVGVTQRVPGGLGSQIFMTFGT